MTNIELFKALLKFQSNISNIQKDSTNPFFKNKYASLSNILDSVNDVLISSGLVIMQHPIGDSELVRLKTIVMHAESGEFIESEFAMTPVKKDPQGIGSCITYMRRYALAAILKLNVDEDDDGNSASQRGSHKHYSDPKQSCDAQLTYEGVMKCIQLSMTLDELKENGKLVNSLSKTLEERDALTKAYRDRMAFLKGEE